MLDNQDERKFFLLVSEFVSRCDLKKDNMKEYKVIKITNYWSSEKLGIEVEQTLNRKTKEGWSLEKVQFLNGYAYIVFSKGKQAW